MLADIRHAARTLGRAPAYLAAAVLTLALGVGATTALFGVVDRVLLRPLPYRDPGRLVRVWDQVVADAVYDRIRTQTRAFASVAGYGAASDATVIAGRPGAPPEPVRVPTAVATGNLFETLGVGAALGRALRPDDARPDAEPVAVLSDGFWRARFRADRRAVGEPLVIDGVRHRVVGVMPPAFRLPTPRVAAWTPARVDPARRVDYWWQWRLQLVGRLAPGATAERAGAEARAVVVRAGRDFPQPMQADFGRDLRAVPLQESIVGGARTTLYLLLGAVLLVLAVAVVNVTGLALVRAAGRSREVTVRAAVGASGARIVRQLVAEGVVVAAAAAALGAALAWAITRAIVAAMPGAGAGAAAGALPRADEIGLDWRAFAVAAAVALAAGVLSAFIPAVGAARADLRSARSAGARGSSAGAGARRALEGLVVAQVALGVVLAAGAGLVATSLARLRALDPGFRAEQVTMAEVPPPPAAREDDGARARLFYDALLARARAIPGVRSAALASAVPFDGSGSGGVMDVEAHPRPPRGKWNMVAYAAVSPGATRTLGVPLVAGRDLADGDRAGGALVALVDAEAARRYWPEHRDPAGVVGERVRKPGPREPWITVVGVVGSVRRDSLNARPEPTLYLPVAQGWSGELRVLTRGAAGPEVVAPALRRAVAELEPAVPVGRVRAVAELVDDSAARPRFVAGVLVAFAAAAVLLGAVGVYGVVAFAVARRTREVGVRAALGATPAAIRRLVLRDSGRLAAAGVAIGLVGAVAAGRAARGLLFGVGAVEPLVLAAVPLLLVAVTLAASALPARRAARVSLAEAMRAE
jgi:predicted permease